MQHARHHVQSSLPVPQGGKVKLVPSFVSLIPFKVALSQQPCHLVQTLCFSIHQSLSLPVLGWKGEEEEAGQQTMLH
eukprot:2849633-Amphidinium_carterae.1